MVSAFFEESIIKRAQGKKMVEIEIVDLRKFAKDNYGSVDDRPYGGGAGMVMRVDVLHAALNKIKSEKSKIVLTSAKGKLFNQDKAQEYSQAKHLILIAGHYEGVDDRILEYVDEEISLGDFVMTGGEIATAAIVDSIVRLIPGVLKKEEATQLESFFTVPVDKLIEIVGQNKLLINLKQKGVKDIHLIEYPHYTRPEDFNQKKVPEILLQGNHKEIEKWRLKMAFEETQKKRPDLLQ